MSKAQRRTRRHDAAKPNQPKFMLSDFYKWKFSFRAGTAGLTVEAFLKAGPRP